MSAFTVLLCVHARPSRSILSYAVNFCYWSARRVGTDRSARQEGRRYRLRRRNVGARTGATIVAVSFLPVSNGVERGRDEPTRRARALGAALVRQAQDRSRDHPRNTAPTGRIPRASSAAAANGYSGDTR